MTEKQARSSHDKSNRKNKPFVWIDCSKIHNPLLLEGEIFGHQEGSWEGAYCGKIGLLEVANGGTFFFYKESSLPKEVKLKFFKFLETGMFKRIGGQRDINVNVVVMCSGY